MYRSDLMVRKLLRLKVYNILLLIKTVSTKTQLSIKCIELLIERWAPLSWTCILCVSVMESYVLRCLSNIWGPLGAVILKRGTTCRRKLTYPVFEFTLSWSQHWVTGSFFWSYNGPTTDALSLPISLTLVHLRILAFRTDNGSVVLRQWHRLTLIVIVIDWHYSLYIIYRIKTLVDLSTSNGNRCIIVSSESRFFHTWTVDLAFEDGACL